MRRNRPGGSGQGFTFYSPPLSPQNTTSESTTEPESLTTTSSTTVVSRRYARMLV